MHAIDEMVCRKICRENAREIVATPRARPDAEKRVPAPSALVEDFARLVRRRVARRLALASRSHRPVYRLVHRVYA
jgi:hypothetical protein